MKPSIGRIVHFVVADGLHRPAMIVSAFDGDVVDLHVFKDPGRDVTVSNFQRSVRLDPKFSWGSWHWPEREE